MNHTPLILSYDLGTQSARAMLFNDRGELLGKARVPYEPPYFSSQPQYAEQHPDFYYDALCSASRQLREKKLDLWGDIVGVALTTFRDTEVCLDEKYNVLRPAILWLDQRKNDLYKKFPKLSILAYKIVGMYETARDNSIQNKANWIQQNEPQIWAKTRYYVMLSAYLNYRLTGLLNDSIAGQVGRIPFDYQKRRWMSTSHLNFPVLNVSPQKMIPLVEPGELLGHITPEAANATGIREGTPLLATGGDKSCETAGTGAVQLFRANLSYGTAATVQLSSTRYIEPSIFLPAYPAVVPNWFNMEYQIYRGYWMVSWFKKEFAHQEVTQANELGMSAEELLNQKMAEIPPGSDGLVLHPYWGAGLKMPEAKGSILGFTDVHTRYHMYRAIVEGIGYGLREALERIAKKAGQSITEVTVSGGGSQSDAICQITADILNLPVYRVQTFETSGLGAAMIAFLGLKHFSSYEEAVGRMVHYQPPFQPNSEAHQQYEYLYNNVYRQIYTNIKKIYKTIHQ